jgi:large subunit ribosomal protein L3
MKFILAQKKAMTQLFNEETGKMTPVTTVIAGPCFVSQIKTVDKDGYSAVQVVFQTKKSVSKPQKEHFKNLPANARSKEFRMSPEEVTRFSVGDKLSVSSFTRGDVVAVTGMSKGHGFQGVVKRHSFAGSPASHGHKDQLRMPGSIGATDAARVFKGTRMGGHMGDEQITTTGLTIEAVDTESNILHIRGGVPGAINGTLFIKGNGEMNLEKATPEIKNPKTNKVDTKATESNVDTKPVEEKEPSQDSVVKNKNKKPAPNTLEINEKVAS